MKFLKKLKRSNRFSRYVYYILILGYIISYAFFVHSVVSLIGIETIIRYSLLFVFLLYFIFYLVKSYQKLLKRKYKTFYFLSFITILIIILFSFSSFIIDKIYSYVSSINDSDYIDYTSYLIALKDTDQINTIGIIDDKNDNEGYVIAQDIIKKNKLDAKKESYDNYIKMLYALYSGDVDGIFVSSNYVTLFSGETDFANIENETKVVYSLTKKLKNADEFVSTDKELTEPFTVLVMGVDSAVDGLDANAAFNGDTLIMATFNPKTLTATLFSIPRDTYVPIACRKNNLAKINSSAAYGSSCVISTIEQLTGITIDYYAKINFKGVVKLVEAVGGVEVDVQAPDFNFNHGQDCKGMVCEQDSNRRWGKNTIYLKPGKQVLDGEEALAYARCRGVYADSDLARNRHQQDIIMALAKKVIKIRSYSQFQNILNAISSNIATNMSTTQILSSYNILKSMLSQSLNGAEFVRIQKSYLEVYNLPVYLPGSDRITSALGYYDDSLNNIVEEMKINLNITKPKTIKTFSFDEDNYEAHVAGKGIKRGASNSVLSSFIGKTKTDAENYCCSNNIKCSYIYIDENSEYFDEEMETDLIAYQTPHANTIMKGISEVTFYIIGK